MYIPFCSCGHIPQQPAATISDMSNEFRYLHVSGGLSGLIYCGSVQVFVHNSSCFVAGEASVASVSFFTTIGNPKLETN
jgi:hypothetical protein